MFNVCWQIGFTYMFEFTQGLADKVSLRKKKTRTITSEMLDNKSASIHHHYTAISI